MVVLLTFKKSLKPLKMKNDFWAILIVAISYISAWVYLIYQIKKLKKKHEQESNQRSDRNAY